MARDGCLYLVFFRIMDWTGKAKLNDVYSGQTS